MREYEACVKRFLEYLEGVKNCSVHTLRNYRIDLECFKNYLREVSSELEVGEIHKRTIRNYLAYLHLESAAKRTVLRKLSSLRSFFKYLLKEKLIVSSPMEGIENPKREKCLPHPIEYAQVERLFEQPDTNEFLGFRDRCIMELLYSSGLRVSELIGLNRADFDPKQSLLRVKGKGRKERVVPVTQNAVHWITSYLNHPERYLDGSSHRAEEDAEAIFLNKWGKRLTARSVDRHFEKYLLASGLSSKVTPHTIRHSIATHWLEKGMDLKTIQVLLGHASLATTTIYTQVSSRLKREVYEKTHPLETSSDVSK